MFGVRPGITFYRKGVEILRSHPFIVTQLIGNDDLVTETKLTLTNATIYITPNSFALSGFETVEYVSFIAAGCLKRGNLAALAPLAPSLGEVVATWGPPNLLDQNDLYSQRYGYIHFAYVNDAAVLRASTISPDTPVCDIAVFSSPQDMKVRGKMDPQSRAWRGFRDPDHRP
jgi:hypothetical protein